MLSYDELTSPERELWDAFPEGRRVSLRTGVLEDDRVAEGGQWGPGRTVRAAVIVALLQGANTTQSGAVPCLRLAGARISGRLYLAGAQIAHAFWLEDCWLEEGVNLSAASSQSIAMLRADRLRLGADDRRHRGCCPHPAEKLAGLTDTRPAKSVNRPFASTGVACFGTAH